MRERRNNSTPTPREKRVIRFAEAILADVKANGLSVESYNLTVEEKGVIDFRFSAGEYHFVGKCRWRRWDGTVTPANIDRISDVVKLYGKLFPEKTVFGIIASDSDVPTGVLAWQRIYENRIVFLTGPPRKWAVKFNDTVLRIIAALTQRTIFERIVAEEKPLKKAKNFTAALAAASARFIDLVLTNTVIERVESNRIHPLLRGVQRKLTPRRAMYKLFPTQCVRAIDLFCTEVTRNTIEPKTDEMLALIKSCYEDIGLRLPNKKMFASSVWRGGLYHDIQQLSTSNLAYYDLFSIGSLSEGDVKEQKKDFQEHFRAFSTYGVDHKHAIYEFDDYFRDVVSTFRKMLPPLTELWTGKTSIDHEVHFLYSFFDAVSIQLAYMPPYANGELYRKAGMRLAKCYELNLWPIIESHLNEDLGESRVLARFDEMSLLQSMIEKLREKRQEYLGSYGHRYLEFLRTRQESLGKKYGNVLGRDGLYCALGQFSRELFKYAGRWEELRWDQKLWRPVRGFTALRTIWKSAVALCKPSSRPMLKPRLEKSGKHELYEICMRDKDKGFSIRAYDIETKRVPNRATSGSEVTESELQVFYVNEVLSGFCNVTNLLSRGTPTLLGSMLISLTANCPVERYHRVVAIPSRGVVPASLLSFIFNKKMSIAHVHFSLDMWPRHTWPEKLIVVDDGVQTGFTMFNLLREFNDRGYRHDGIPLLAIYRFQDKQIDRFHQEHSAAPELSPASQLAELRERVHPCFEFASVPHGTASDAYRLECISDKTDGVETDTADAFITKARDRICKWVEEKPSTEWLRKEIKRICKVRNFYKPSLLFDHPKLLLRICSYFHRICVEKGINVLIARDEFGVPLATGICLLQMFAGGPNLQLLIAQKGGTFISGLSDLLARDSGLDELNVATVGTSVRSMATEVNIERTLLCASHSANRINPKGLKVERKTLLTVFRSKYLDHLKPIALVEDDIHEIVPILDQ